MKQLWKYFELVGSSELQPSPALATVTAMSGSASQGAASKSKTHCNEFAAFPATGKEISDRK